MDNRYTDLKEEYPLTKGTLEHLWVQWPAGQIPTDHTKSLHEEPPIRPGTPDPYTPPQSK